MDRRRLRSAAVVLLVGMLFAACGSGSTGPHRSASVTRSPSPARSSTEVASTSDRPSTTQSSTPTASTTASIEAAAQSTWLNFWKVALALGTTPKSQWPSLVASVAVEPSYSEVVNSVRGQLQGQGEVGYGYVVSHPSWPNPPKPGATTLVMADCYDGSHAGSKVLKTGKIRTVGKARTNARVTMTLGADGKWRVKQTKYLAPSC